MTPFPLAREAAKWLRAFYPDVTVSLDRDKVTLQSDDRSEGELELIWQATLVNEKLLKECEHPRQAMLAALLR